MNAIKISVQNKPTSLRLTEKTKRMLESLAKGKETHEQILLRLIRMAGQLQTQEEGYGGGSSPGFGYGDGTGDSTSILPRGSIIGTRYARVSNSFSVEQENQKYEVVCTYNDLTAMALLRSRKLRDATGVQPFDWEIDLELVNVKERGRWQPPMSIEGRKMRMLTLICLKAILEETFNVRLFELASEEDYTNAMVWKRVYEQNGFSRDSLNADILKVLG